MRHRSSARPSPALEFAVASLATWRLAHLLAEEDGPLEVVVRLREGAGETWVGELMDCFFCLSVWVAAPLALLVTRRKRDLPTLWLGISGAACILEQATGPRPSPDPAAAVPRKPPSASPVDR